MLPFPAAAQPLVSVENCMSGSAAAAAANARSLTTLAWRPFGRNEIGWQIYASKIATEIDTRCAGATPGFAAALARWQARRRLAATGAVDPATFAVMKGDWQAARPFVALSGRWSCPLPPTTAMLAVVGPGEGYGGKAVELRRGALLAWRQMRAAARREVPAIAAEPRSLQPYSGFRDPTADALRCLTELNCNGIVRATCSAHRTGLAVDMWVGQAPGYGPDSSADPNRLAMVRTLQYRWLLTNAARFGFVNYVFEPWHWEWTGEPVAVAEATNLASPAVQP